MEFEFHLPSFLGSFAGSSIIMLLLRLLYSRLLTEMREIKEGQRKTQEHVLKFLERLSKLEQTVYGGDNDDDWPTKSSLSASESDRDSLPSRREIA